MSHGDPDRVGPRDRETIERAHREHPALVVQKPDGSPVDSERLAQPPQELADKVVELELAERDVGDPVDGVEPIQRHFGLRARAPLPFE